jgi:hypothetical protein
VRFGAARQHHRLPAELMTRVRRDRILVRSVDSRDTRIRFRWQTEWVTRRAASIEESDVEAATATLSEDELIRRATADRAAGRDDSSDVEACLSRAADQNQAALDRLAK